MNPDPIDSYAGLGEDRDAEQIKFSQELVEKAKAENGIVQISTWEYRGKTQWYAQRLIEGDPKDGAAVWQGPNPPMGYHTSERTFQIIDYSKE
jgi:hypothetical protein